MADLLSMSFSQRADLIEEALAQAFEIEGIAIEYNQGDQELVVANPLSRESFFHHDLSAIARDLERRLFPNG